MNETLIDFCIKNRLPFVIIFDKSYINEFIFEEYNIDTSAQHPTSEGDDIVRAYMKDKYKSQEIKNS